MLNFVNDYSEGCAPEILLRLEKTNFEKTAGYGADEYSASAKAKIRSACGAEDADIFFIAGGTQTNQLALDCICEPFGGVICADTGHINAHEAGAIEYTGHKVIGLPHQNGKLSAETLHSYMDDFLSNPDSEHMVIPSAVYLSFPTEYGTLYSKEELKKLTETAKTFDLKLYLDGARLGYGLVCEENDVTLSDIASLCDAFYIGGTKIGALFGEALVFPKGAPSHMLSRIKQHGALLSKGRIAGLQFDTLFTDELYFRLSRHAVDCAFMLKEILKEKGYRFYVDSPTNQIFTVVDNRQLEELSKKVQFSFWEKADEDHSVIRFVTSWATDKNEINALRDLL